MTRIMTNVAAINAQRNLNNTAIKMGKVLEQLSSGYRINRAADDAAGLGISEKMRAQIRGNQQALRNVQDGISMLQTGEGAMDEVHSMLQRMRELAVQAANGTYADNGPERTSMGQEIVQLANEIDRISTSTEFNGQKLLTGALSTAVDATSGVQPFNTVSTGVIVSAIDVSNAQAGQVYTITNPGAPSNQLMLANGGITQTLTVPPIAAGQTATLNFNNLGVSITLTGGATAPGANANAIAAALATAGNVTTAAGQSSATLQVGANTPDTLTLNFTNMSTPNLGGGGFLLGGATGLVTTLGATGIVGNIAAAHNLMTAVDGAIQQLSAQRGTLGAAQNRLEHTANSLGVAVENLSASESRIRDADIAQLSSDMVSNQILQQAGVSVLAQANQSPQAILKLLQG